MFGSGLQENQQNKTVEAEKKQGVSALLHLQEGEDCAQQMTS